MDFPIGRYYLIIAGEGGGERALRIQNTDHQHFNKSRVMGAQPNPNDAAQLFMVQKTGLEDDSWQIINCISNYVFDEESKQIRLKKGKKIADQLFKLEKYEGDKYWIKCDDDDQMAVCLEGIVRYRPFNSNDRAQIFKFRPVINEFVQSSYPIINLNSGKALDIPSSTFQPDTSLIQFTSNMRFNQRWIFTKRGQGYMIQSLLNGLVLDIANESQEGGSSVIQWNPTGNSNQLWLPKPAGLQCCYKIGSLHAPGMYLCVKNQSMDDFGKLEIWDQQNPSMYWKIQNFVFDR